MLNYARISNRAVGLFGFVGCIALVAGCGSTEAELLIKDRPMRTDAATGLPYYTLYAGDSPTLSFRAKFGYCDYAIMYDELNVSYEDCGPDVNGVYEWKYKFQKATDPGVLMRITATGYFIDGIQDIKPYNGKLLKSGRRGEPEDALVAQDSIFVKVYSSTIRIPVNFGERSPIWKSAKMYIYGPGATRRIIEFGRLGYDGEFRVEGPDANNGYVAIYEPTRREINPTGETRVELVLGDDDANIHTIESVIQPPTAELTAPNPAPTTDEAMDDAL